MKVFRMLGIVLAMLSGMNSQAATLESLSAIQQVQITELNNRLDRAYKSDEISVSGENGESIVGNYKILFEEIVFLEVAFSYSSSLSNPKAKLNIPQEFCPEKSIVKFLNLDTGKDTQIFLGVTPDCSIYMTCRQFNSSGFTTTSCPAGNYPTQVSWSK